MTVAPDGPLVVTLDQLVRPEPGGIGTYVRGLLRGLDELRASGEFSRAVVGLVPGPPRPPSESPLATVVGTGVGVRATTRAWRWRGVGVPRDAAIVHATSTAGPFRGGASGAVHSVLVHDLLWRAHPEVTTARGARFHEQRLRQIVEDDQLRVLVTSESMRADLVAAGAAAARVHVVRLGVRAPDLVTDAPAAVEGPFTLCVGTIQPRKNIERLARAHARARVSCEDLGPLVLVGARAWGSVDTHGAIELGALDDGALAPLMAAATVVAYVPVAEGWGFPAVEALVAGRPTVVSSGVPSTVGNAEAVVVDPLDVEDIARGLLEAARQRDGADERARRRESVAHLTWAQCARDHVVAWS